MTIVGKTGYRFQLGRELGRGGFGVVRLASGEDGRSYAVKLIGPVRTPEVQATFEREVQIVGAIEHEHILNIVDFGSFHAEAGDLYLFAVSEYCSDGDYRARPRNAAPLPIDQIHGDFGQILDGLHALHSRVIHRDLKPENILVSGRKLNIGDFGLSKLVDEATKTLTFKGSGSPAYMAPEVWELQHRLWRPIYMLSE
jgi:serine/threonine protein kinase